MMFNIRLSRLSSLILVVFALAMLTLLPGVSAQVAQSVELVGMIEAMSVNSITVNQQEINTTGAQLNAQLVIGALVKVEGTLNEDGSISARQVNPAAPGAQPGEGELTGILESINGTLLVVNGQTIDVTGAQIAGTLAVGQQVRVHASAAGPNTWRAREVEAVQAGVVGEQPPVAGEFEIVGTLESISGGTLTIAGQTISFVNAEIKSPLVVGALVKVHVSNVNGVLVAREIELAFGEDDGGDDNANGNANTNGNDNANANVNGNANDNSDDNDNANDNSDDNGNANVNANVAFNVEQAIAEVLRVYPNAQIRSIELTTRFGGTLVWEIQIAGRIELIIDAQSGVILVIDQPGRGGDDNSNGNSNGNDDDGNDNSNSNGNSNDDDSNSNSNSNDDGGNSNGGGDGGNSNSGGDDGGDDDGGGDDDNSGMG